MTGICAVNFGHAVVVWADTLAIKDCGMRSSASKILSMPNMPAVYATAGDGLNHALWLGFFSSSEEPVESFDDLVRLSGALRREYVAEVNLQAPDLVLDQTIIHAGWSHARKQTGLLIVADGRLDEPVVVWENTGITVPVLGAGPSANDLYESIRSAPMTESMRRLARACSTRDFEIGSECVAAAISENRIVLVCGKECECSPIDLAQEVLE